MITSVRGMNDLFGEEMARWGFVEAKIRSVFRAFGYTEFRVPALEKVEVFSQTVGEDSDIVEKQMYTFTDASGEKLALRPEGTASFMRAAIEHQLHKQGVGQRYFYYLPMFRGERPQKGRLRQFHQFGAECLNDSSPESDAELIALLDTIFRALGIEEFTIRLNNIGDEPTRIKYREVLQSYFKPSLAQLCPQCQGRFERAPMRILDCKNESCRVIARKAPILLDHLDPKSRAHHQLVKAHLTALGVPYVEDPYIVRGLDYYSQSAFEFDCQLLGAQSALGAGGRYDGLAERFGEAPIPAVGWALGMERVMLVLEAKQLLGTQTLVPHYFFAPLGEKAFGTLFSLQLSLKKEGVSVEMSYEKGRSLKSLLKQANRSQAKQTLILGDQEYDRGIAVLRDMETSQQLEIPLKDLKVELMRRVGHAT